METVPLSPSRACLAILALGAAFAIAGCGGSGSPQTVDGCEIKPSTSCPGADLSGADLSGANLSESTLTSVDLTGTNLKGADLTQANLGGAKIVRTNLSDADLTGANLVGATISAANLDGATLCGTVRTDGTTDDSSCPATTGTTSTESTETTSDAKVTTFDVGGLTCGAATTAPVDVTWATESATAVEIAVDTFTPKGFGPSGATVVAVPCDGQSHEVTITPQSDSGPGEPETKTVSP